MKTYSVYKCPNNDYVIKVTYADGCTVRLRYCYNNIGNSYSGTMIESFVESIRGLLRVCPNFFDEFDTSDYNRSLMQLGFTEVEFPEKEKRIADFLNA